MAIGFSPLTRNWKTTAWPWEANLHSHGTTSPWSHKITRPHEQRAHRKPQKDHAEPDNVGETVKWRNSFTLHKPKNFGKPNIEIKSYSILAIWKSLPSRKSDNKTRLWKKSFYRMSRSRMTAAIKGTEPWPTMNNWPCSRPLSRFCSRAHECSRKWSSTPRFMLSSRRLST